MSRIPQLHQFLEQNPADSFIKFALALEYLKQNDETTALQYFLEIQQKDPGYTGTYYHLGKLYERINNLPQAEATYREGLRRTVSSDPHAHRELQQALNDLLFTDE